MRANDVIRVMQRRKSMQNISHVGVVCIREIRLWMNMVAFSPYFTREEYIVVYIENK